MPWFKRFYDPIILPDGRKLLTQLDAADHHHAAESRARHADWQVAMETLLLVAERDGPERLPTPTATFSKSCHADLTDGMASGALSRRLVSHCTGIPDRSTPQPVSVSVTSR
jgi:hypothetical protein